ncbi:hypothetical protein ACFSRY_00175 [Pontibacter locisalis]|uniref:SpoIIAA-like n=1 Tax=Pontibacter locisalis TaxID=1719035 RepID=A0ABW5IFU5_9BACT
MIDFENDYLHIWVDQEVHLMHSDWLRKVSSEEYRQGNDILINILRQYDIRYWIADSSKLGDITKEDQLYTIQVMVPQIGSTGLKKIGRISGEDRVSIQKFREFMAKAVTPELKDLEVRQFESYKEAADWIGNIHP